jgi:hypothetical protein
MSQSDLNIANVSRSLFRTENNEALQALASLSSDATEPTTTYPFQLWADTTSGALKQRNEANNAWAILFYFDDGQLAQLNNMLLTGAINEKRSTVAATATTTPIWVSGTGNIQDWTGTPTITNFPAATQAGARRIAYPAAGTIITDNANIDVQGDATYTIVAGDKIEIEALTTTTFKVWISQKAGTTFASNAEYAAGTDTTKPLNSATARARNIVAGTPIATTSGTSHDFTGIPSWVKEITINFVGVSTNGASVILLQIGDSGGIENSGYLSTGSSVTGTTSTQQTTGFGTSGTAAAAHVYHGILTLSLVDASTNTWAFSSVLARSDTGETAVGAGSKSLSAALDRLRITTVTGVPTFDGGLFNVNYK